MQSLSHELLANLNTEVCHVPEGLQVAKSEWPLRWLSQSQPDWCLGSIPEASLPPLCNPCHLRKVQCPGLSRVWGFGVLALSICFCHLPGTGRAKATFPRSLCSLRSVSDGDSPNQRYFCESHLQNWAVCWVGWPASKGSFLTFTCWLVQFCDITLKVFPGNPHLIPWAT